MNALKRCFPFIFLLMNCSVNAKNIELNYSVISKSNNSLAMNEECIVIKNQAEFDVFWNKYIGGASDQKIDFRKNRIVGVFYGQKPSLGYGMRVTKVVENHKNIVVDFLASQPSPDPTSTFGAQVVSPYEVISIPFSRKEVTCNKIVVNL